MWALGFIPLKLNTIIVEVGKCLCETWLLWNLVLLFMAGTGFGCLLGDWQDLESFGVEERLGLLPVGCLLLGDGFEVLVDLIFGVLGIALGAGTVDW